MAEEEHIIQNQGNRLVFGTKFKLRKPRKNAITVILNFQNINSNHRANDIIVKEGQEQTLVGRFMYGWLGKLISSFIHSDVYGSFAFISSNHEQM